MPLFFRIFAAFLFCLTVALPYSGNNILQADGLSDILERNSISSSDQNVPLPKIESESTAEEKTNHIIYEVIRVLLIISGVVAVVFIVVGGVEYSISAGQEDRINGGKSKLQYALIGLTLVIFSYAILTNAINFLEVAE